MRFGIGGQSKEGKQKVYEEESRDEENFRKRAGFAQDELSEGVFGGEDISRASRTAYEKYLDDRGEGGFGVRNVEDQLRTQYGLEGDKLFEYATRLSDVAGGREKTQGQIRSERALEILTGAQRGRARSQAGFDTATALRQGSRAAQQSGWLKSRQVLV